MPQTLRGGEAVLDSFMAYAKESLGLRDREQAFGVYRPLVLRSRRRTQSLRLQFHKYACKPRNLQQGAS